MSASEYDVNLGGKKGNVRLASYDGKTVIQRSFSDNICFDERLQVAKQLIDNCIHRWSETSNDNIKALVEHAFQTDKQGNINMARILGLRRIEIDDSEWQKAMEAIADSITVTGSKSYIRLYQRIGESEQLAPISLDVASV